MKAEQYVNEPKETKFPNRDNPLVKKSWDEFRATGLFLFINNFLHIFGWALTLRTDKDNNIIDVFPSRTIFRGYSEDAQDEDYKKLTNYLAENSTQLLKEVSE